VRRDSRAGKDGLEKVTTWTRKHWAFVRRGRDLH